MIRADYCLCIEIGGFTKFQLVGYVNRHRIVFSPSDQLIEFKVSGPDIQGSFPVQVIPQVKIINLQPVGFASLVRNSIDCDGAFTGTVFQDIPDLNITAELQGQRPGFFQFDRIDFGQAFIGHDVQVKADCIAPQPGIDRSGQDDIILCPYLKSVRIALDLPQVVEVDAAVIRRDGGKVRLVKAAAYGNISVGCMHGTAAHRQLVDHDIALCFQGAGSFQRAAGDCPAGDVQDSFGGITMEGDVTVCVNAVGETLPPVVVECTVDVHIAFGIDINRIPDLALNPAGLGSVCIDTTCPNIPTRFNAQRNIQIQRAAKRNIPVCLQEAGGAIV